MGEGAGAEGPEVGDDSSHSGCPREAPLASWVIIDASDADLCASDADLCASDADLKARASLSPCLVEWSSSISIKDVGETSLLGEIDADGEAPMASFFFFDACRSSPKQASSLQHA